MTGPEVFAGKVVSLMGPEVVYGGEILNGIRYLGWVEVGVGGLLLGTRLWGQFPVIVGVIVGGFFLWDLWRFGMGDVAACGCFGSIEVTTEWWHVLVKDCLLGTVYWMYVKEDV